MEVAYIITNTLSFVTCTLVSIIGLVSPVYRNSPARVIIWMAINLVIYSIIGYLHIGQDNEDKQFGLTEYICMLFFYGLNIIFVYELWLTLINPFISPKKKSILYIIIFIWVLILIIVVSVYWDDIENVPAIGGSLQSNLYQGALDIMLIFTIRVFILLKETQHTQDQSVYLLKVQYFKIQMAWFITICGIELISGYLKNKQLALVLLYLMGFIFGMLQLLQRFPILKMKTLFFPFWSSEYEKKIVHHIENGTIDNDDYQLTIDLLKQAQILELVKCILLGIKCVLFNQFQYNPSQYPRKRVFQFKINIHENESKDQILKGQSVVTLKSYYPEEFQDLMKENEFNYDIIKETLGFTQNSESLRKAKESMGRSGAFFFFSQNNKLIIKTMTRDELKGFLQRALQYFQYMKQNPQTLIAKIYGLYKLSMTTFSDTYLILMENSFEKLLSVGKVKAVYDLKGSTIDRMSKSDESVKKDMNFRTSQFNPIYLKDNDLLKIKHQIQADSNFFLQLAYMDYSMLLAVSECDDDYPTDSVFPRLLYSENRAYSISIIDYLQNYDCSKQFEFKYKSIKAKDTSQLSCIEPIGYSKRFIEFCDSIFR